MLDDTYVYQNRTTGAVSSSPLTTRQLCRLLCPVRADVSTLVTPDTQVLLIRAGKYEGTWQMANRRPVLQEACAEWHYTDQSSTSKGPVSCRDLARLLHANQINDSTQVWSSTLPESNWRPIQTLTHLKTAIDAFQDEHAGELVQNSISHESIPGKASGDHEAKQVDDKDVQDELEAFLSSTDRLGPNHLDEHTADKDDDNEEGYESDGGTQYVKDRRTGNWIHAALAQPRPSPNHPDVSNNSKNNHNIKTTQRKEKQQQQQQQQQISARKRKKKAKFSAKNAKCWIYVTGLPVDATLDEVSTFFSKVGIIDLDPETQKPKVKLYCHKEGPNKGRPKGDASVCYARPESVELALQLLDEAPFRPSVSANTDESVIRVERAKFEQHGGTFETSRKRISNAQRKVAKLAALQAVGWDDEADNGRITGGRKGLHIVVLKHLFTLDELKDGKEDAVLASVENQVRTECEQWGVVEKITIFSKNPEGVVIVKFAQPRAATTAVSEWDGREQKGRRIEAMFWDGVTDFTVRDEEKEQRDTEKRLVEFGEWLDKQEVPEEFQLQVEGS